MPRKSPLQLDHHFLAIPQELSPILAHSKLSCKLLCLLTDIKVRERDVSDLVDCQRRTIAVEESNSSLPEASSQAARVQ